MSRQKVVFQNNSEKLFKLSRSKMEMFCRCSRCFYLDQKLGIKAPPSFPFTLNNAVDALLKKEFDRYRELGIEHPSMKGTGLIPAKHERLEEWRNQFDGVKVDYNGFHLYGGIDDLLYNKETGKYHVCDYKATSSKLKPTISMEWQVGYRRQLEFYKWLLSWNGLDMSDVGYLVYCNANRELEGFNSELKFDMYLVSYNGSSDWVRGAVDQIREVLESEVAPPANENCDLCKYSIKRGSL